MSRHTRHATPGNWTQDPWPAAEPPRAPAAERAAGARAGAVGVLVYLAVLVCTGVGVYISWRQGSQGGGKGAIVAGAGLLVAAAVRLVLPVRLAGLLASRRRATDVLTLTVLGAGLLVAGLVLPR